MGFSASDIERFTYCHLSWWLASQGNQGEGEAIAEGEVQHTKKGYGLWKVQRLLEDHRHSLETALYLTLVAASAATLAIEITFLDPVGSLNVLMLLLSLMWLFVALVFLYKALRRDKQAADVRRSTGLVAGEFAYSDLALPGEVLRTDNYDVSIGGKPDYIVRRGPHLIPVEVKTGKTPTHPHDSHVMQCMTYCLLIEDKYGQRPPYGIISYDKARFEVPYNEEMKDKVLETILRMRLLEMTKNVHRSHARPGKCAGCSRKAVCNERLR